MLSSHRHRIRPSNGSTLLVFIDLERNIRSVSGPLIHFLNYKAENIVGKNFSNLIVPNDWLSFESLFNPKVDRSEFGIYRLDGSVMFADVLVFDVLDENEQVSGHCLRLYDISARMQQIDALLDQENEFKKILDQMNEIVCIFRNERLVYANSIAARILAYSMDDLYGANIAVLFETSAFVSVNSIIKNINNIAGEQFLPVSGLLNATGDLVSCQTKMKHIYFEGQPAMLLIAQLADDSSEHNSELISDQVGSAANNNLDSAIIKSMNRELKQPLLKLNCITGRLLNTMLTGQQREMVEEVQVCETQMNRIIGNSFELYEIQSGKMKLLSQPIHLESLAIEAIEDCAYEGINKHTELFYLVSDDVPQVVSGDKEHIRQILTNFLAIIIQFTGSGEISLTIKKSPVTSETNQIIFEIHGSSTSADTGFAKELREIISPSGLTTVSDLDNGDSAYTLAFRLITLMGGTLLVAENYGNNADLSFSLPMEVVADDKPQVVKVSPMLNQKKVLIVDDNSAVLCNLKSKLASLGMEVTAASSGSEAMNLLRNKIPLDLALIDYHLPGMSGEQLARKMESLIRYEKLPKILLSSLPEFDAIGNKLFVSCLPKPIKWLHLAEDMHNIFRANELKFKSMTSKVEINKLAQEIPLKILIAEDNLVNQKFLISLLNIMGYSPASVINGQEVLDAMENERFDIILMDIQMPVMSGIEATELIMEKYPPSDRPYIIAITANALNSERERCLEVGMVDFMVKPVNIQLLQSTLEKWGSIVKNKTSART